jgi:hypothetical protein
MRTRPGLDTTQFLEHAPGVRSHQGIFRLLGSLTVAALAMALPATATGTSKPTSGPKILRHTDTASAAQEGYVIAHVPVGAPCHVSVLHGDHEEGRSLSPRSGKTGDMQFFWLPPVVASPGEWKARVGCRGYAKQATTRFNLIRAIVGSNVLTTEFAFHFIRISERQPPVISPRAARGPKGQDAYPARGTVLVREQDWFGGRGVPVFSNGGYGASGPYTSVELLERFVRDRGWYFGSVGPGATTPDLLVKLASPAAFDKHHDDGYVPVPGDAVVFSDDPTGRTGSVAIVDRVDPDGSMLLVEQNVSPSGREALRLQGGEISGMLPGRRVVGILHAKANRFPTSPPPPSPPPAAIVETTGGLTGTFTDPVDLTGDPLSLPPQMSVTVSCKTIGRAAADGNTWWYRIATPPWQARYASADAFYNNGATSGPLRGTPFVDPTVPDC